MVFNKKFLCTHYTITTDLYLILQFLARSHHQHLQDKVAWDNKGHTQWEQVNIIKLCQGTTNPKEPGECFDKVMNGHIKWGEGDVWKWENAISLCAGTSDAEKTIDCFQKQIHASTAWDKAIQQCQFKDASTTNIK